MVHRLLVTMAVLVIVLIGAAAGYMVFAPGATGATTSLTSTSSAARSYSVNIGYKGGFGSYLTNGSGFTLYYRTTDNPSNGTSTCTGVCVKNWPVFYASNLALPSGLNSRSFSVVTRADGLKQLTFNGWPLYLFAGDKSAGTLNGQGLGGIWFVLSPINPPVPASSTTTASSTSASGTSSTTSSLSTSATTTAVTTTATSTTTTTTSTTTATTTSTTTTVCYYYCP